MDTRKDLFEIYRKFRFAPSRRFASPAVRSKETSVIFLLHFLLWFRMEWTPKLRWFSVHYFIELRSKNSYDPLNDAPDTFKVFTVLLFGICDVVDRFCNWEL
jgi:hypothetical protein